MGREKKDKGEPAPRSPLDSTLIHQLVAIVYFLEKSKFKKVAKRLLKQLKEEIPERQSIPLKSGLTGEWKWIEYESSSSDSESGSSSDESESSSSESETDSGDDEGNDASNEEDESEKEVSSDDEESITEKDEESQSESASQSTSHDDDDESDSDAENVAKPLSPARRKGRRPHDDGSGSPSSPNCSGKQVKRAASERIPIKRTISFSDDEQVFFISPRKANMKHSLFYTKSEINGFKIDRDNEKMEALIKSTKEALGTWRS
jgi:hypothetical protein